MSDIINKYKLKCSKLTEIIIITRQVLQRATLLKFSVSRRQLMVHRIKTTISNDASVLAAETAYAPAFTSQLALVSSGWSRH